MGCTRDLEDVQHLVSLFFDLGFRGTDADASRLAGACITQELCQLEDFKGLSEVRQFGSFVAVSRGEDLDFLEHVVIPAADSELFSHKRRRVVGCVAVSSVGPRPAAPVDIIRHAGELEMRESGERSRPWAGPRAELTAVCEGHVSAAARVSWAEEARVRAITGSCPKSLASVVSGLRCWLDFACRVLGRKGQELPPTEDGLVAWSVLFRCSRTYSNYLNHVRIACDLVRVSSEATHCSAVKRATRAIEKRSKFTRRKPRFITRVILESLVEAAKAEDRLSEAMLYIAAYAFLLRVPSEGLPMCRWGVGSATHPEQSVLTFSEGELVLTLASRKNRPHGSRLVRSCWCLQSASTCPVHVLWPFFDALPVGFKPFSSLNLRMLNQDLRRRLERVGVGEAQLFRTHDFRRGHAGDLQTSGATLLHILEAGEWRSPAFLKYLDMETMERDLVVQAHLVESSDDEEGVH